MNRPSVRPVSRPTDARFGLSSIFLVMVLFAPASLVLGAQLAATSSTSCYVLLKPDLNANPPVAGKSHPVCKAVLDNMNRFCGEPPQYDHRALHPLSSALREPDWMVLQPSQNLDLIKKTMRPYRDAAEQDYWWSANGKRIQDLISTGELRLSAAEVVGLDLRGGAYSVYRIENSSPGGLVGSNQPHTIVTEKDSRSPSPMFAKTLRLEFSDLWQFDESWFLINYIPVDKWFLVQELVRPTSAPVGAPTVCTFQYSNDVARTK